jgi:hypothetical protein
VVNSAKATAALILEDVNAGLAEKRGQKARFSYA